MSYLRKKLWAVGLHAGIEISNDVYSLFVIHVFLTDDGFDHLDDVLEAIYSYLKLLQLVGPKESLFRELQTTTANAFRFTDERNALENVKELVLTMTTYPPKYILTGANLYLEYDESAIRQTINELNSQKFNIMITSKRKYNEDITYELTEPWFGTKYTEIDMPEKWISLWKNATPLPEFALPESNPFITDDFSILYQKTTILPEYPTKILDNDLCELWFRQDDKFLRPTACYEFYFMTPVVISSVDKYC